VIKSHLKKNGTLYILYGPMVASGFKKINRPITENLRTEKFEIIKVVQNETLTCCCFVARPT
jgi:hypothetical protein